MGIIRIHYIVQLPGFGIWNRSSIIYASLTIECSALNNMCVLGVPFPSVGCGSGWPYLQLSCTGAFAADAKVFATGAEIDSSSGMVG